jgi:hypothetical protein
VIAVTGLLYAAFYILTALAAITYYRRRILIRPADTLTLGILPLAAIGFLGWVVVKSVQTAPAPQLWSLAGILAVGVIVLTSARLTLRSPFLRDPPGKRHPHPPAQPNLNIRCAGAPPRTPVHGA